ncbi:MAG: YcaO-like family protein, partial [Sphingomonadaceae bacterium]|nr:YcaO-like family protein [Sphingomonadaceae bacterium]
LAERFDAEGPVCRFDALPERARAPALSDFARDRDAPPEASEAHSWVAAEDLGSGDSFYLPFDLVSLDLTRSVPSRFDRTSTGLAAGATREEATAVALNEIIERDAVAEWSARGMLACTADGLRLDTAPFGWLREWRERLDHAGSPARFYRAPSITGAPVFVCELNDHGKDAHAYRAVHGTGCHPIPEIALFRALAEAIQGRATLIAGAREDMPPSAYARRAAGAVVAFGLPLATGMRGVHWDDVAPGPTDAASIVDAFARSGYPRVAMVDFGSPHGFEVVRAFVCGLGAHDRRRRASIA